MLSNRKGILKKVFWFIVLAVVCYYIYILYNSNYAEDDFKTNHNDVYNYEKSCTSKIDNRGISETKKIYYKELINQNLIYYHVICSRFPYYTQGVKHLFLSIVRDPNFEDIEIGEEEDFKTIIRILPLELLIPELFSNDAIYNKFRGKKKPKTFPKPVFEDIKRKRVVELLTLGEPFDFKNFKEMSREDRNSNFLNIKKELEEILDEVELPEEVNSILKDSDNFTCILELLDTRHHIVNRNTIELMKSKCHNKFIKHIINNLIITELVSVGYRLCQFVYLKREILNQRDFFTGDYITDPVHLDFNSVSFSKFFYSNETSPDKKFNKYDMIIFKSVKISIDFLLLSSIEDYLELYFGIKIPEIMIDILTTRIIRNPVILVSDEYYFVDEETIDNNKNSFQEKSPYTSSPLSETFLEKYIRNNTTNSAEICSDKNTNYQRNELKKEMSLMKHHENILKSMIDEFISLFPDPFRIFLKNYRETEEVLHT